MQIKIEQITERLNVRSIKPKGVERLKRKISEIGYLPEKPVIVAPNDNGGYVLIDGNHRVTALEALDIQVVEALVDDTLVTKALQLRRARLANEVSETIVPTTFVDDAELVWRLSGEGMKQTEIGGVLGWGREKVAQYSRLKKISDDTWFVIVTTFLNGNMVDNDGSGNNDVTTGNIFNERLLRPILSLTAAQQLELVTDLSTGKLNKQRFKKRAMAYKTRNQIREHIIAHLPQIPNDFVSQRLDDIDKGGYDTDWQTEDKPKASQLIQAILDEWEQKSGTRLIFGDFETEVNEITDQAVDLILTDIPYNVSKQGKLTKVGQDMANAAFDADGDWDSEEMYLYETHLTNWAVHWMRILKQGGSVISFCDKAMAGFLWGLFKSVGMKPKNIIVWERTNPHPSGLTRKNLISSIEVMVWAVKPGQPYTFNSSDNWDRKNIIKSPFCSGSERITDEKENVLHPTQKPLTVLLPLVEVFSNRGDLVLDGFMGVGSTGEAALSIGRKFIGIENNQKFFEAAQRRLGAW